jgi:hypothetical protein
MDWETWQSLPSPWYFRPLPYPPLQYLNKTQGTLRQAQGSPCGIPPPAGPAERESHRASKAKIRYL